MMDDKQPDQREAADLVKRHADDLLFVHQYEQNQHNRVQRELECARLLRGEPLFLPWFHCFPFSLTVIQLPYRRILHRRRNKNGNILANFLKKME